MELQHRGNKSASKDHHSEHHVGGLGTEGSSYTRDERDLIRLGKKPVLKVSMNPINTYLPTVNFD